MLKDINTSIILETVSDSNYKIIISNSNKEIITLEDIKLIIVELLLKEDLSENQKQDLLVKLNKFKNIL